MRTAHQKHTADLDRKRKRGPAAEKDMMMMMMKMKNRRSTVTRNNKRIAIERDYEIDLRLKFHHAEGLDSPSNYPSVTKRNYRVVYWVHPDDQHATLRVSGSPDPEWNQNGYIEIDKSRDFRFLYVEVLRFGSPSECNPAGTSNGVSLVGRAQIPLPKLSTKTGGRYGLVRLTGDGYKAEGHIILSMQLVKTEMT